MFNREKKATPDARKQLENLILKWSKMSVDGVDAKEIMLEIHKTSQYIRERNIAIAAIDQAWSRKQG